MKLMMKENIALRGVEDQGADLDSEAIYDDQMLRG
jgi:hypothetical protein